VEESAEQQAESLCANQEINDSRIEMADRKLACDVLVVGGGTAGFTAAVLAARMGAGVVVIEKNAEIGGEGMVSGSNGNFGGGTDYQKAAGVADSPELFFEDMRKWDPKADPDVLRAFTENTVATLHFLRDLGVKWNYRAAPEPDSGSSVGRIHTVAGRGPALYSVMRPALEAAGGEVLTQTKCMKLLTDSKGAVTGVLARNDEGSFEIKSGATILTCGGFQGNLEMMTKYVSRHAAYGLLRGLPTNTGDAVLMGLEIGAATRAMERVHGYMHLPPYPVPYPLQPFALPQNPPDGKHIGVPGFVTDGFPHCIVVNITGERFADESRPRVGENMCNALLRQPEALGYLIADSPLYDKYLKSVVEKAADDWKELGFGPPRVVTASTVEELARNLEINPGILGSTVGEYNKAVQEGTTHLLRIPKANRDPAGLYQKLGINFLHKIETPPFYAVLVIAGYSHSNGGLAINGKGQVLDREKRPISRLYAAGDTAVLWHGNYAQGYSQAHTQGYIAARNAVAEQR
jgi:fumarate reductase flavoprotein subunit